MTTSVVASVVCLIIGGLVGFLTGYLHGYIKGVGEGLSVARQRQAALGQTESYGEEGEDEEEEEEGEDEEEEEGEEVVSDLETDLLNLHSSLNELREDVVTILDEYLRSRYDIAPRIATVSESNGWVNVQLSREVQESADRASARIRQATGESETPKPPEESSASRWDILKDE